MRRMIENGMVLYTEAKKKAPVCPVCGEECESIYKDRWGNICGCENCVEKMDAWEEMDHDQ